MSPPEGERPDVEPREPIFRHLDDPDMGWQPIREQQNSDGSISQVREKWLAFSPDPEYLSLYAEYDPRMIVRRHGHYSSHIVFVLKGELMCGDRLCPEGTHIELPLGAAFGPLIAGPKGCTLYEVMMGDPRSWSDDPDSYKKALKDAGARQLPDPPLEFPEWLSDLRDRWAKD